VSRSIRVEALLPDLLAKEAKESCSARPGISPSKTWIARSGGEDRVLAQLRITGTRDVFSFR
jgi:hypothetical protein